MRTTAAARADAGTAHVAARTTAAGRRQMRLLRLVLMVLLLVLLMLLLRRRTPQDVVRGQGRELPAGHEVQV